MAVGPKCDLRISLNQRLLIGIEGGIEVERVAAAGLTFEGGGMVGDDDAAAPRLLLVGKFLFEECDRLAMQGVGRFWREGQPVAEADLSRKTARCAPIISFAAGWPTPWFAQSVEPMKQTPPTV